MIWLGLSSLCPTCGLAITYASSVPLRMGGTCGGQHVIAAGRGFEFGQPDKGPDVRDRNPGEAMSPSPQPYQAADRRPASRDFVSGLERVPHIPERQALPGC